MSVEDDGIGIDPENQERVFPVFDRLHSRDEYEGTGIGLALCERLVERHGGSIWIDSEPGKGATVSFTLPAARSIAAKQHTTVRLDPYFRSLAPRTARTERQGIAFGLSARGTKYHEPTPVIPVATPRVRPAPRRIVIPSHGDLRVHVGRVG